MGSRRDLERLARRPTALILASLAWVALAAPVVAADETVTIAGFAFSPGTVTIQEGDSVTWTNADSTAHTATGDGFDTESLDPGQSSTIAFATAGTFAYACAIHQQMTGTGLSTLDGTVA